MSEWLHFFMLIPAHNLQLNFTKLLLIFYDLWAFEKALVEPSFLFLVFSGNLSSSFQTVNKTSASPFEFNTCRFKFVGKIFINF